MDGLFDYLQRHTFNIYSDDHTSQDEHHKVSGFQSGIRFDGRPILPPILNESQREEMRLYKHQAVMTETHLKARAKQNLLERVQTVLSSIPIRRVQLNDLRKSLDELTVSEESSVPSDVSTITNGEIRTFISQTLKNSVKDETNPDSALGNSPPTAKARQGHETQPPSHVVELKNSQGNMGTMDSGISSKLQPEHTHDEPLDTMAEVSDISSEEHNDADDEEEDLTPDEMSLKPEKKNRNGITPPEQVQGTIIENELCNGQNSEPVLIDKTSPNQKWQTSPLSSVSPKLGGGGPVISVTLKQTNKVSPNAAGMPLVLDSESDEMQNSKDSVGLPNPSNEYGKPDVVIENSADILNTAKKPNEGSSTKSNEPSTGHVYGKMLNIGSVTALSGSGLSTGSSEELSHTVVAISKLLGGKASVQHDDDGAETCVGKTDLGVSQNTEISTLQPASDMEEISEQPDQVQQDNKLNRELETATPLLNRAAALLESESPEKAPDHFDLPIDIQEPGMKNTYKNTEKYDTHENRMLENALTSEVDDDIESNSFLDDYHDLPTPGPSATPNVSDVPYIEEIEGPRDCRDTRESETQTPEIMKTTSTGESKVLQEMSSQFTEDNFGKSEEISTLQTASTDLAPYMATSQDTIQSSMTTLPNLTGTANTGLSLHDHTYSELQEKVSNYSTKMKMVEEYPNKPEELMDHVGSSTGRVRRNSYTLEAPSPALLKASQKGTTDTGDVESSEAMSSPVVLAPGSRGVVPSIPNSAESKRSEFQMTSSMEDLKLKPVQRKLHYDEQAPSFPSEYRRKSVLKNGSYPTEVNKSSCLMDSEKEGKEEHLHRYLQHLQQMPVSSRKTPDVDPTSQFLNSGAVSVDNTISRNSNSSPITNPAKKQHVYFADGLQHDRNMPVELAKDTCPPSLSNRNDRPNAVDVDLEKIRPHSTMGVPRHQIQNSSPINASSDKGQSSSPVSQTSQNPGFPIITDANVNGQILTEEDLLQSQMEYFEKLRVQLMQQQQQQLALLLAEQQKQQLMLQNEFVEHSMAFSSTGTYVTLPATQISTGTVPNMQNVNQNMLNSSQTSSQLPYYSRPVSAPNPTVRYSGYSDTENCGRTHLDTSIETNSLHHNSVSHSSSIYQPSSLNKDKYPSPETSGGVFIGPSPIHSRCSSRDKRIVSKSPTQNAHSNINRVAGRNQSTGSPHSILHNSSITSRKHRVSWNLPEHHEFPPEWQRCFERVSAAAKGYLTRRLLHTEKVQQLIKTISDTAEFAIHFQQESPIKNGIFNSQDKSLQDRVINQLTAAMYEIHEIFFELSVKDRMALISQSRTLEQERQFKAKKKHVESQRISAATLKAMERRKKAQEAEAAMMAKVQVRPKSAPPSTSSPRQQRKTDISGPIRRNYQFIMNRALKPIQANLSPIKPVKDNLNRAVHVAQERDKGKKTREENNSPVSHDHHPTSTALTKNGQHRPKIPKLAPKRKTAVVRPSANSSTRPNPWK